MPAETGVLQWVQVAADSRDYQIVCRLPALG
jgi:hypothetical protein